jgi:hypothetical protein
MSFLYEDRPSDSPYVRTIWHTQSENDGCYMASADGSWDLLVVRQGGDVRVEFAGPATRVAPIAYREGSEYLGIRFAVGTFMPHLPPGHLVDEVLVLRKATSDSFWLDDAVSRIPEYEHVETFVERLVRSRLLLRDEAVQAVVQGDTSALSQRSVQRHFLRATGLTPGAHCQIERARHAATLLRAGVPILDAVDALGYADQSHMTRALKRCMGQTPAQLARGNKP